jgi:hypothetical protein
MVVVETLVIHPLHQLQEQQEQQEQLTLAVAVAVEVYFILVVEDPVP